MFPCKSTSFSSQLSHFLSVSHVEHYISLKRVTSKRKTIQRKWGLGWGSCIMQERTLHAKTVTVIFDQIGPGQNRCLAFSTFTFKKGKYTKSDRINHFQCIIYTFIMNINSMSYIQYILVMVYTHFYANKDFLGTIVAYFDLHRDC